MNHIMKIYKTLLLTGVFLSSFASIFSQEEIYEQGASCPIVTNRYSLQNSSTPITGYPTSGYHTANDIVVMFFWASWCGPYKHTQYTHFQTRGIDKRHQR